MKIIPSALIDTITQTSGGTTIQNSYGGLQLHKKAYQKKKKTVLQQNARSAFTNVQSNWGSLSSGEQDSWNAAADPGVSGFQLYSSTNNRLVNQGIAIIPEYVAPTIEPINDLVFDSETFNYVIPPYYYQVRFTSALMLIPTSGWTSYIKWTGWITASEHRYPEAKLIVPAAAGGIINAGQIFIEITEEMSNTFRNFRAGSKAQFIVGLVNNTTGQIFTYLNYEAIA